MVQDIRTIGLPALQSFHTVARLGGISAAAERLGMAKSGVSRHVAQLEAHLGVRLLERGARSVRLTPIGTRLDARIRSILAEVDLLGDIAREESAGISGLVSIATTAELGSVIVAHYFPLVRARYPDLKLVMRTAYAFEDMQDPAIDIAFRVGSSHDDRLVARSLGHIQSVLAAAPDFAARHPVQVPEDLAGIPCLAFRGERAEATWRLFGPNGQVNVEVSGPFGVQNLTLLRELGVAGEGMVLLPEFMLADALTSGDLVRCLPDYTARPLPVFLTFRPGARNVARIDAAITLAEREIPKVL